MSILERFFRYRPEKDPSSFGNIAIRLGLITAVQLQQALDHQVDHAKATQEAKPLGAILKEFGWVDEQQVEEIYVHQLKYRDPNKLGEYAATRQKRLIEQASDQAEELTRLLSEFDES